MLFDKNTFIVPAASSDTHVYLKNTDGVVIFVIDPLSISSLFTVGKEIRIKTKSDLHILSFDTSVNAISALPTLRASLDSITAQNAPLTGGGAINYVAKFTPNGTTISNSILYDNGTGLGIGTITPLGLLHIKSTSGITFRTESSTGAIFNINNNNTITYTGYNVSITGTFKYVDGNQATGYILTSDLNGNAIWQAPALLNLQQVLTNGSSTGGLGITSPDTNSTLTVENGDISISSGTTNPGSCYFANAKSLLTTNTGTISVGEFILTPGINTINICVANSSVQHGTKVLLYAPIIEVSQNATTALGIVTLQQLQASSAAVTLQQVLTNNPSTGGLGITSPDASSFMYISNGDFFAQGGYSSAALIANNIAIGNPGSLDLSQNNAQIFSNNGSISVSESNSTSNRIQLYIAKTVIRHSIKNYFDSPLNEVSQNATTPLGIVTLQQLQSNLAAAPKKYTETASSFIANVIKTINHNIGNTAISITLWDSTTGDIILGFDANNRTLNSVDIDISVTGNYDIVIIG